MAEDTHRKYHDMVIEIAAGMGSIKEHLVAGGKRMDDMSTRIRALEQGRAKLIGIGVGAASLVSIVIWMVDRGMA